MWRSLQLTANALCDGDAVVWIGRYFYFQTCLCWLTFIADCFQALQQDRLRTVTKATQARRDASSSTGIEAATAKEIDATQFYQYSCFTLPHLISLVSRPTIKLIPTNTSLVVISSFSALVNSALPKSNDGNSTSKGSKGMVKFQRVWWC